VNFRSLREFNGVLRDFLKSFRKFLGGFKVFRGFKIFVVFGSRFEFIYLKADGRKYSGNWNNGK
jgi:hypothetical protein